MITQPVIGGASHCLAHVPNLVRYGSKPRREIKAGGDFESRLNDSLRSTAAAIGYAPNQTFIGNVTPEQLARIARPWYTSAADTGNAVSETDREPSSGRFGAILDETQFYGLLEQADVLDPPLVSLCEASATSLSDSFANHSFLRMLSRRSPRPLSRDRLQAAVDRCEGLPLWQSGGKLAGLMRRDNRAEGREDANLDAATLLEGLCAKASGAVALQWLLSRHRIEPSSIDFLISCGEEATGDRYQRGGGGMAKAIGEMCGCVNASGMDIKNFCAAPASALVTAGALVAAGLYRRVAVVAGGSLAKLGMKSVAFLHQGMPVLDDCLASHAFLVGCDDHISPRLCITPGSIGIAKIGASTADEAVYRQLLLGPLEALKLTMTDIDKYAPELHNPEIMELSGSGDVVHKNYRMIAAMAVRAGVIQKSEMESFIERIGMIGYAPTQGHIPSGVAYLGHAINGILRGSCRRVMILSKASLFLNRLTDLYDGVSFVIEANPGRSDGEN